MSYDRQIDQICPHQVVEEALFLFSDRQTVRPLRPIASSASVKVRINGVATVPPYGFLTPALAKSSKQGLYDIQVGVNDKLVLSVDGSADQVLTAPSGEGLTAQQVVDTLNRSVRNAAFSVVRRRIRLRTRKEGREATLFVRSSGSTLADTIGIPTDRGWRGQKVYPGWSLIRDPNTLRDNPTRYILFDDLLKGTQEYVELNYVTVRSECRRCGGLGVENDWRYGETGEIAQVRDEALMLQEVLKAIYTVQGSNPFHRWYGSNIINTVGRKLSSMGLVQNLIVADIHESFRRWQVVKRKQEEEIGQVVSDAEFPFRLISVVLEQSQQDPTVIFVNSIVQNRSQQPIQIERGIKLPQPLDILGSTTQQGVFRQSLSGFTLTG